MHVTQAHVKTMPHAHLPMAFTPAAVQAVSQEHNANQVGDTICNENTSSLHVIDQKNNDQMEIPDATSLYSFRCMCLQSMWQQRNLHNQQRNLFLQLSRRFHRSTMRIRFDQLFSLLTAGTRTNTQQISNIRN